MFNIKAIILSLSIVLQWFEASATPFILGSPPVVKDQHPEHLAVYAGEDDLTVWWYDTIRIVQQFTANITGPNNCTTAVNRMKYNVYLNYNDLASSSKTFTDHYFYGRNMIYWYGYNSAKTIETYNWDWSTF